MTVSSLRRLFRMLIVVAGAAVPWAVGAQATPAGSASSPLGLRATCDATGPMAVLRVQLANKSDRPTAVVVGFKAANGQTPVVNSMSVIAIRQVTGAEEAYVYVNAQHALAKGPAWIVSLAPGATHDVELPLYDFISTLTYANLDPTVAAGTRFVFEARPSTTKATPVWTGKIETVLEGCRQ